MSVVHRPQISICVCTFQRPHLLRALLDSLAVQTFPRAQFEIIVVDNDATGSGRTVIDQVRHTDPTLALHYAIESTPGVSHARNRSVAMTQGELIAFIDDDETACPNWLADLLHTLEVQQADAVFGPVIPQYPLNSPAWSIKSRFFERPRHATGVRIPTEEGRTGNALVRAERVKARQPTAFMAHLARTGGEDYDFFKWLVSQDGILVWCDSAPVHEEVPLDRQRLSFMTTRTLRTAINYWRSAYDNRPIRWILCKSVIGLVGGCGMLLLTLAWLPFARDRALRAWIKGLKGLARVVALTDIRLIGYGKDNP